MEARACPAAALYRSVVWGLHSVWERRPHKASGQRKKITSESGIENVECSIWAVEETNFPFVQPWIDSIIKRMTYLLDGIRDQEEHHGGSVYFSQVNLSGCHFIAANGGRDTRGIVDKGN